MKNKLYFLDKKPIIGESFFAPMPKEFVALEKSFEPLEKSLVWQLNELFWKHYSLWEATYGEHFEKSLPSGISESHDKAFIKKSAKKFFDRLIHLEKYRGLPEKIYVLEIGPGTGIYAKKFLDEIKRLSEENKKSFYDSCMYVLVDTSEAILKHCGRFLVDHRHHTKLLTLNQLVEEKILYEHRFLFIRHSNVWGQFPADIVRMENKQEVLLSRAVIDTAFVDYFETTTKEKFLNVVGDIEKFITTYPSFWKPFCKALKLQTKWQRQKKYEIDVFNKSEVIISNAIFEQIDFLTYLTDWERGYMEIIDYIARSAMHLEKKRRIAKFDGSLGYCVNGPLIKNYLRKKGKHVSFEKLKKLNTVVTIQKDSFENIVRNKTFVIVSEIAAKKEDTKEFLLQKAHDVFALQTDMLTFSDKAHALPDFLSVEKLLEMKVFEELPSASLLSVFAMRRKTKESLPTIIRQLQQQGVRNLIVVTGDPCPPGVNNIESGLTVMDGLEILSNDFFTGATCYAKVADIPRMREKIAKGAKFFIVQSTFDTEEFNKWAEEMRRQKLYKKAAFIPSLIPLTTMRTIDAVKAFPDIAISDALYAEFGKLSPEEVFAKGMVIAKDMVKAYNDKKLFAGAYIYSKNPKVLKELIGFVQQ